MAIDKKRFLRGWEQEGRFYLETIKEYFFPKVQVEISKQRHQEDFSSLQFLILTNFKINPKTPPPPPPPPEKNKYTGNFVFDPGVV